jgi:hypothetical protein
MRIDPEDPTMDCTTFYTSPPTYTIARAAEYVQWALTRSEWRNLGGIGPKMDDCYWVEMTECGRVVARQGYMFPAECVRLDGDTFHETTPTDVVEQLLTIAAARIRNEASR